MMKLTDEILNKYIDGELDQKTLNEVREILRISEEDMKRLKALQFVHQGLKNMKEDEVSSDFTQLVMSKLQRKVKVKKEDRFFIFSISSVFVGLSLIIIGYVIYSFDFGTQSPGPVQFITNLSDTFESWIISLRTFLNSVNTSVIGSIFSFVIIISAYFLFENFKHTKEQLSKFN